MDALPQFMLAGLAMVLLALGIVFAIIAIVNHRRQNATMTKDDGEASSLSAPMPSDASWGASLEGEAGASVDADLRLSEEDVDDESPTLMTSQDDDAVPTDADNMGEGFFPEFEVTKSIIAIHVSEIITVS